MEDHSWHGVGRDVSTTRGVRLELYVVRPRKHAHAWLVGECAEAKWRRQRQRHPHKQDQLAVTSNRLARQIAAQLPVAMGGTALLCARKGASQPQCHIETDGCELGAIERNFGSPLRACSFCMARTSVVRVGVIHG